MTSFVPPQHSGSYYYSSSTPTQYPYQVEWKYLAKNSCVETWLDYSQTPVCNEYLKQAVLGNEQDYLYGTTIQGQARRKTQVVGAKAEAQARNCLHSFR
jgi:hypothetical protein